MGNSSRCQLCGENITFDGTYGQTWKGENGFLFCSDGKYHKPPVAQYSQASELDADEYDAEFRAKRDGMTDVRKTCNGCESNSDDYFAHDGCIVEKAVGKEQGRWQQAIYELARKRAIAPDEIDGGGCDSGDPLDLTLTEIGQVICQLENPQDYREAAPTKPLPDLCRHLARHMASMIVPGSVAASEEKFHEYLAEELPRVMGAQPDHDKLARPTCPDCGSLYLLITSTRVKCARNPDAGCRWSISVEEFFASILRNALSAPAMPQEQIREALQRLYDETADYIRINNLGDVHHNVSMQMARDALAAPAGEPQPKENQTQESLPATCMGQSELWCCSLAEGHSGLHKAYENHNSKGELLETWPSPSPLKVPGDGEKEKA